MSSSPDVPVVSCVAVCDTVGAAASFVLIVLLTSLLSLFSLLLHYSLLLLMSLLLLVFFQHFWRPAVAGVPAFADVPVIFGIPAVIGVPAVGDSLPVCWSHHCC